MTQTQPDHEKPRKDGRVIDQRQQQIDPAGKHRVDQNESAKRSQKQPGQDLDKRHEGTDDAK